MQFNEIQLTDEQREEIDTIVAARNDLDAHNKQTLRLVLTREMKQGLWAQRDYLEADNGEPPRNAVWN